MKDVTPESPRRSFGERLGTAIDRAVSVVAPVYGSKRSAARLQLRMINHASHKLERLGSGHPSMRSSTSRDSRWFGSEQNVDEQLLVDLEDMQRRAVEMVQTNPHAAGVIDSRVTHEIGVGLGVRPNIAIEDGFDKEVAAKICSRLKRTCKHWSRHGCDRKRRLSFAAVQRLVTRTYATYGEAFVVFSNAPGEGPIDLAVEVIDPIRVQTPAGFASDPNVCMGIRYDSKNQIAGYYVMDQPKASSPAARYGAYQYISRYDKSGRVQIVHVFEEQYPGQTRGIPWLTAAVPYLKDLGDYWEAELISKQVEACFSIVIEGGKNSAAPMDIAQGKANAAQGNNRIQDLYPGAVHYTNEGEQVKVVDPVRPGSTFAPFVENTLRLAASALNYPYELLAKNFFRTTYSSGRLAILDGNLGFKVRTQAIIDQFLSPLWVRFVGDVFFFGLLDDVVSRVEYVADPHKFEDADWGGNSFGSVDPEKEVNANAAAIESGQKTLSAVCAENDEDWIEQMDQRDVELRKAIDQKLEREKYEQDRRAELGLPPEVQADPNNPNGTPANGPKVKPSKPGDSAGDNIPQAGSN